MGKSVYRAISGDKARLSLIYLIYSKFLYMSGLKVVGYIFLVLGVILIAVGVFINLIWFIDVITEREHVLSSIAAFASVFWMPFVTFIIPGTIMCVFAYLFIKLGREGEYARTVERIGKALKLEKEED